MIRFRLRECIAEYEFKTGGHLNLKDLAEKAEIHRTTLSRIINQRGYNTTTDNIDKLCFHLQCRVEDLMEYVPTPKDSTNEESKSEDHGNGQDIGQRS